MPVDLSVITDHWRFLAYGVGVTIALAAASGAASLALGFVVALARLFGPRSAKPAVVLYIDSMRAVPVLVVLVWTFFALPILTGLTMQPFVAALIGLTVHLAAYAAVIYRAGIESVRPGQTRGSLLSVTIKDTAIASVIAVPEIMRQSETLAGQSFQPIEVYSFAMLVYFLILFPATRGVDRIYRRVAHLGRS